MNSIALSPNLTWNRLFTQAGAPSFLLINQYGEPTSYVAQWQAAIQRELTKNMSLEVTYMGSAGIKLRRLASYNLPQPGPGNPNANRAFPKFNGAFQNMYAAAHSNYNSLQARLQHKFAHGFTLLGSYAYSKSIDNGSGVRTTDGDPLTPMDPDRSLWRDRGLSAFDFRHRLTTSFLLELPFGKGRQFDISNPAVNAIFGGWQLGGILTFQSGFPFSPFCGPGNIQNGAGGWCAPDAISGAKGNNGPKTVAQYFDTAAYVDRLGQNAAAVTDFRFGTAGRNTLIGPGIVSLDASINKAFKWMDGKQQLDLRGEFFNMPNHPVFGQPGSTLRTATYGVITGTRLDSRQIQVALRYTF